ncbi:MAG: hypothetical protein C4293_18890 [Nitrospiraceae bacterium]
MSLVHALPLKHHTARLFLLMVTSVGIGVGCMKTTHEGVVMRECPELNLRSERSIVEVLSRASNNSLVAECLVRVAKRERDIDPNDPEQVDYIRRFQHLLQRDPTTDQIIKWQQENPFPKKKSQR